MLFVYILLGMVAAVLLLLCIPLYFRVTYDGALRAHVRVLGVAIPLLPRPEKEDPAPPKDGEPKSKKGKKSPGKAPSKWQELAAMLREDGPGAMAHYLTEIAKLAGQAAGRLMRAIAVDSLRLELLVAADDPADTAVRYGQVCAVIYPALAAIGGPVRIRRRQIRIDPNFLLEKSDARLDLRLHVGVYRLLWAALVLLVRFMLIKDNQQPTDIKGGQA